MTFLFRLTPLLLRWLCRIITRSRGEDEWFLEPCGVRDAKKKKKTGLLKCRQPKSRGELIFRVTYEVLSALVPLYRVSRRSRLRAAAIGLNYTTREKAQKGRKDITVLSRHSFFRI